MLSRLPIDKALIAELSILCSFLLVLIYYITKSIVKKCISRFQFKANNNISKISTKIIAINKLLNSYDFAQILDNKRLIIEKEYSRKSYDRAIAKDVIFYHFDNNINDVLIDVRNAFNNKKKYDDFLNKMKEIKAETTEEIINQTKYTKEKFHKIEDRVITKIVNNQSHYNISLVVKICYESQKGQVNVSKEAYFNCEQLFEYYDEWNNRKKYSANIKIERQIMNDNIRYNVLKRDNYTCQICGATAKEGAKLHVDHIIPVSRGGKTVMSNLQTLCERCNMGKSNKIEKDFEDNMICPKCGAKLVKRKGKYGFFIGCSNYPKCHYYKR